MQPEAGALAPDFKAPVDGGENLSLRDLRGKKVVLYFYPQDDTETCTKQACDFRDNMERITTTGAVVIGVSPDSIASHNRFRDRYNLNFHLVADTDRAICMKYGVWVEKTLFGRTYMGVERSTFIIDKKGRIRRVFRKVRLRGHVDQVIEALGDI